MESVGVGVAAAEQWSGGGIARLTLSLPKAGGATSCILAPTNDPATTWAPTRCVADSQADSQAGSWRADHPIIVLAWAWQAGVVKHARVHRRSGRHHHVVKAAATTW